MRGDAVATLCLLLGSLLLLGMGNAPQPGTEAGSREPLSGSSGPPDAEFLEFLASFDAGDGRFVDPASLQLIPLPRQGGDHEE